MGSQRQRQQINFVCFLSFPLLSCVIAVKMLRLYVFCLFFYCPLLSCVVAVRMLRRSKRTGAATRESLGIPVTNDWVVLELSARGEYPAARARNQCYGVTRAACPASVVVMSNSSLFQQSPRRFQTLLVVMCRSQACRTCSLEAALEPSLA